MLTIKHIELAEANSYVERYHRHHKGCTGHRFSIAAYNDGKLCGVVIVGRPIASSINQAVLLRFYDSVQMALTTLAAFYMVQLRERQRRSDMRR